VGDAPVRADEHVLDRRKDEAALRRVAGLADDGAEVFDLLKCAGRQQLRELREVFLRWQHWAAIEAGVAVDVQLRDIPEGVLRQLQREVRSGDVNRKRLGEDELEERRRNKGEGGAIKDISSSETKGWS
jgi:hypothetical protein